MVHVSISETIFQHVPQFKLGVIHYDNIVVSESPQMLRGRFQLYQEQLMLEFDGKTVSQETTINEWRSIVKMLGADPSRYRHSAEALLRRVTKGHFIHTVNSAVDVTNLLSLQYKIPFGIYDCKQLEGSIRLQIGTKQDTYEALNDRTYSFANKLVLLDENGPFGSPFVDSKRSRVTEKTTRALHIIYIKPSLESSEAKKQLEAVAHVFYSLHGGDYTHDLIEG